MAMKLIIILCALFLTTTYCSTEEKPDKDIEWESTPENDIEYAIADIESTAVMAERIVREGILPVEETEKYYNEIVDILEELIQSVKTPTIAYIFLKAKGIDRVFIPNIGIKHPKLRTMLLILIKEFFQNLPTTTVAAFPVTAIDQLVDIFENDDNLGIKAHALDILALWLPENPEAQVRIIKKKGLEPFYRQIPKLDMTVTSTLLELFNTVLKEHIRVRSDVRQRNKADSDKLILYQRMGLIERMSKPTICNGLLAIFYSVWTSNYNDVIEPIFDLIKTTKPYCAKLQKGNKNAIKFFETVLERFQSEAVNVDFERHDMNQTEIKALLEDYLKEIKDVSAESAKDEF